MGQRLLMREREQDPQSRPFRKSVPGYRREGQRLPMREREQKSLPSTPVRKPVPGCRQVRHFLRTGLGQLVRRQARSAENPLRISPERTIPASAGSILSRMLELTPENFCAWSTTACLTSGEPNMTERAKFPAASPSGESAIFASSYRAGRSFCCPIRANRLPRPSTDAVDCFRPADRAGSSAVTADWVCSGVRPSSRPSTADCFALVRVVQNFIETCHGPNTPNLAVFSKSF